jgi:hypothetical protein
MTLLFIDGFDHYTNILQKYDTNPGSGGTLNSAYARTGTGGFQSTSSGGVCQKYLSSSTEHATLIAGIALRRTATLNGSGRLLQFLSDTGSTIHATLNADSTGKLRVTRGDYNATLLGSEAGNTLSVINVWHYVEVKILLSDTVGTVEVRVDGNTTPVINLTGQDTKNAGTKTVFDSIGIGSEGSFGNVNSDDFYVCNGAGSVNNDFLGDIKIDTLLPNNNGFSSALVGSDGNSTDNYLLVDEVPPNTTDYVSSATIDQKDTYAFSNTTVAGTVMGVQINSFAQKNDAGTRQMAHVTRRSIDYDSADMTVGQGFGYYRTLQETDPNTSAAWTTSGVDGAEFGVKVR